MTPSDSPEDQTFIRSFPEKLMITRVHGTKRGGTHIYGDQTRWQTGPSGDLTPTRKKKKNCSHAHTKGLWHCKPAKATFDLR